MSYLIAFFAIALLGMAKAGLKGMGILIITIMALIYGGKASTGIILPLLMLGDALAVYFYRRSANWSLLTKFLPAMLIGVLIAVFVGNHLSEEVFKNWMAIFILVGVIIMFWQDYKIETKMENTLAFGGTMGFTAGFTTMIGNLAGPFTNIFFLAMRVPKNEFIGTVAWLYFVVNWFKLPFHIFSWETIDWSTLKIGLGLSPALILGFFVGMKVVSYFNQNQYRRFILAITAIGALMIFIK